jgi:hypothetical protein
MFVSVLTDQFQQELHDDRKWQVQQAHAVLLHVSGRMIGRDG